MMPGGFPLTHLRFWVNEVFPIVAVAVCLVCLWAERCRNEMLRAVTAVTLTLLDEGEPVCRITLDDWPPQAGRSLSPTAGWGLPVNAIEFSQLGDGSGGGPISIWVALSATSVGRGWDSAGHAAGTYRNRMRIEWVDDEPR
jgi:hypothetical protein